MLAITPLGQVGPAEHRVQFGNEWYATCVTANIDESELQILTWLHEHAEGYSERFPFTLDRIIQELQIDERPCVKCLSYLNAHGLIDMHVMDFQCSKGSPFVVNAIWLTGIGEDYMRELEREPSIGRKLTVATFRELLGIGKDALTTQASVILAKYWQHFHR